MAPLLQDEDAPALPLEVQFDNRWETAFGAFCANVAERLAAIAAKESAVMPEYVDHVGNAIVEATGDLFDDFEVVRKVARAAIEYIAEERKLAPDDIAKTIMRRLRLDDLAGFAQQHGISMDWLMFGDISKHPGLRHRRLSPPTRIGNTCSRPLAGSIAVPAPRW